MKVVNVIEEARIGGPQMRINSVANALLQMDVETIVYTAARESDDFHRMLSRSGIKSRRFPLVLLQRGIRKQLRYVLSTPMTLFRYWRALRTDAPDVVHVNSAAQWRPAFAAWLTGIPVVWHLNDTLMPNFIRALFRKLMHRFSSGFIVAGARVENYYLDGIAGGRLVTTIQAPIDVERFDPQVTAKADDLVTLPGVRVVNVGNINPDKDTLTLVRLANELAHNDEFEFTVVHAGAQLDGQQDYFESVHDMMTDLKSDNLILLGSRSDIPEIHAACHIYVCTSRSEASPTAVWEALAMGLPIASTDVGDVELFNVKYEFGAVVPVTDYKALAASVVKIARQRAEFDSCAIRKIAVSEFSLESVAKKHLACYLETKNSPTN